MQAALVLVRFLVPTTTNEGHYFPPQSWRELEGQLLALFDGFSYTENVKGVWIDEQSTIFRDTSRRYEVALPPSSLPILEHLLRWVQNEFQQKTLYVENQGVPEIHDFNHKALP